MKKILFYLLLVLSSLSHSQVVEFVVTGGPGGPEDVLSRILAEKIEASTGMNVIVINKPGAAKTIGYSYVKERTGPTLVLSTDSIITHPVIDTVDPIFYLGDFHNIVFTSKNSSIFDLQDLKKISLQRPITFGHGGQGTYSYRTMNDICNKVSCIPVPYKSGPDGMRDVMAGIIDVYSLVSFGALNFENNTAYRIIGHVKSSTGGNWLVLFSRNMSKSDMEKIQGELKKINKSFYNNLGLDYVYKNPNLILQSSRK